MDRRQRRHFSREFKVEAVRLITEGQRPVSEVARELGVKPERLREWRRHLAPELAPAPRSEAEELAPLFFIPWRQDASVGSLNFYVRSAVPPAQQLHTIPALLKRLAPTVPLDEIKTMPQQIRDNVFLDRLISILSTTFASLATLLAAVGLYGILAYTVQQRTREIGVRMALGADAWKVRALVVRQMGMMSAIGGLLGIAAALGLGRLLRSLLYGLQGNDPSVFALSLMVLAAVAFGASYVPVRKASLVDPVEALRYE